jgi:DNA replication protein DnaC
MPSNSNEIAMPRYAEILARRREHADRMDSDPGYRAAYEAEEARLEGERQAEMVEAERRFRRQQVENLRARSEIPKRVWPFLDAPRQTPALDAAFEFAGSERDTILVLAGGVGCGKTVAACAALERWVTETIRRSRANGYRPVYARDAEGRVVKAIDLARAGTFDREFWDKLAAVDFLVVDDLGTEPLDEKGWMVANVRALIDRRYDDERRTILTTNLGLEAFKTRYCADGGRLLDRLRECGAFIGLTDTSLRTAP